MEMVKQFSVQLVNKPGRFAAVMAALSKEKVATRAFCVMDSGARGTLRFVPDDATLAASALETANVSYDASDVLLVEVSGQSGGLPKICQRLAEDHLNIDYSYGALSPVGTKGGSLAVIKVNNLARAERLLSESSSGNGVRRKRRLRRPPVSAP